ncbi:MAG: ATP-binding protein [Nitrospirae bacterium]|nr:ATP-binding protein [Nitrospirota bacterium]
MLPRQIRPLIEESLRHFPVVLLVGARQTGKSTLVQALAGKDWPARYLTLDDRIVLDAALTNPDGFLQQTGLPVILDEVQRAPDLLRAVKLIVDRHRRPGMFLLTGSANILTLSRVSETLAGRVAVHELYPFSWTERYRQGPSTTIDHLFKAGTAREALKRWPVKSPPVRTREIQEVILRGGYPTPALMDSPRVRQTWFESYRQTYIERDLRDLAQIGNLPDFTRLMTTLALRTGQMLNLSGLSRDVGLPFSTLRRYFHILAQTYQVFLVPPYAKNIGKRLVKTPKVYVTDTGLGCHLSATDRWETLDRQNRVGATVETWVANELRKMVSVGSRRIGFGYWRTRSGQEVDFLLECGEEVVGVEVKWGTGFRENDLAGLKDCRDAIGPRFRFGVLLHGGREAIGLDERTLAVPFGVFFGRESR